MSSTEPTRHTYVVHYGNDRIAHVEGTRVDVIDYAVLAIVDGAETVGLYPAATHSATRQEDQ